MLDDSETWAQSVGGRRMVQRYVGELLVTPEIMSVLIRVATEQCTTRPATFT